MIEKLIFQNRALVVPGTFGLVGAFLEKAACHALTRVEMLYTHLHWVFNVFYVPSVATIRVLDITVPTALGSYDA